MVVTVSGDGRVDTMDRDDREEEDDTDAEGVKILITMITAM